MLRFYSSAKNPALRSSATNNKTFWKPSHDHIGRVRYEEGDVLVLQVDSPFLHGVRKEDINQMEPRILLIARTVECCDG